MPQKIKYSPDGRGLVFLDEEDVELAEIYLLEQEGSDIYRQIEVTKIFVKEAGMTIFQASDIVGCAWERLKQRSEI